MLCCAFDNRPAMSLRRLLILAAALLSIAAAPPPSPRLQQREALRSALSEVIKRGPLKNARVSVQVVSLDDGAVVFAQNADDLLNPASNVKLVTAAAALARLGLEYRFETEFLTDAELDRKGKAKILYVRGKGDPSITTERLYGMVVELLHAGLREMSGDLVVDDSLLRRRARSPRASTRSYSDRSYMAPTGALSLNWNTVGVYLRPGGAPGSKARGRGGARPSDYFVVESQLATGKRQPAPLLGSRRAASAPAKQKIVVLRQRAWTSAGQLVGVEEDRPPAALLRPHPQAELLAERGVKVKGKVVKRGDGAPTTPRLLHVSQSRHLRPGPQGDEQALVELRRRAAAQDAGRRGQGRRRAASPKGVEVVEDFLEREVGIPRGTYVMKNGSGLNDTNRFSAAQICKMLRYMCRAASRWRPSTSPRWASPARTAPCSYRFERHARRWAGLRAKTGTLENVSALSGYVQTVGGETLRLLGHGQRLRPAQARARWCSSIDALGAAVAASGSAQGPERSGRGDGHRAPDAEAQSPRSRRGCAPTSPWAAARQAQPPLPAHRLAHREGPRGARRARRRALPVQTRTTSWAPGTCSTASPPASEVYGRLRKVARASSTSRCPGCPRWSSSPPRGNTEALARMLELARPRRRAPRPPRASSPRPSATWRRTAPDELLGCPGAARRPRARRRRMRAAGPRAWSQGRRPRPPASGRRCAAPAEPSDPALRPLRQDRRRPRSRSKIAEAKAPQGRRPPPSGPSRPGWTSRPAPSGPAAESALIRRASALLRGPPAA